MNIGEPPVLAPVREIPCATAQAAESIRVRGLVQGVGFRPTVWRVARECGLAGDVRNDGEGVLIRAWGEAAVLDKFVEHLCAACPPLARIDSIERCPLGSAPTQAGFHIVTSAGGRSHTGIVPDAVTCRACVEETLDSSSRRYQYPFTNCTHCGPRLSIVRAVPYDRSNTTMAAFSLCTACRSEYDDPSDRRFHAQPIACPTCGPHISLERSDGTRVDDDPLAAARRFILQGAVVAIKGLGGFQLACDAADETAVALLRTLKHRERKPFALLARDVAMIKRYCTLGAVDEALLTSPAGPIVILAAHAPVPQVLAASIAPGVATLGFMLPSTPLHHMLMQHVDRPIVLTSGNRSDEPQCIDNEDARVRLAGIADYLLMNDRKIARRVDDSVARTLAGAPRVLRRARGYAPAPLRLPSGFADAAPVLAMGGELKNTFCLLRDGEAVLSHHIGDLENALTYRDFERAIASYEQLFEHDARRVAVDRHPEYLSRKASHSTPHVAMRGCSALCSTASGSATTVRCGAANSCSEGT
jgi:hydrogenase maturation protein HypF